MKLPKFRAWNKKQEKMYYNVSILSDANSVAIENSSVLYSNCGQFSCYREYCIYETDTFKFEDIELMQYINKKDIKKQEIYEGDIVEIVGNPSMHPNLCYIGTKFKVFYNKKSCSFMMQDISNKNNVQYFDLDLGGIPSKDLLVIGNIYKDKKVLEENNERV